MIRIHRMWTSAGWVVERRHGGPADHYRAEGLAADAVVTRMVARAAGVLDARSDPAFRRVES